MEETSDRSEPLQDAEPPVSGVASASERSRTTSTRLASASAGITRRASRPSRAERHRSVRFPLGSCTSTTTAS